MSKYTSISVEKETKERLENILHENKLRSMNETIIYLIDTRLKSKKTVSKRKTVRPRQKTKISRGGKK